MLPSTPNGFKYYVIALNFHTNDLVIFIAFPLGKGDEPAAVTFAGDALLERKRAFVRQAVAGKRFVGDIQEISSFHLLENVDVQLTGLCREISPINIVGIERHSLGAIDALSVLGHEGADSLQYIDARLGNHAGSCRPDVEQVVSTSADNLDQ